MPRTFRYYVAIFILGLLLSAMAIVWCGNKNLRNYENHSNRFMDYVKSLDSINAADSDNLVIPVPLKESGITRITRQNNYILFYFNFMPTDAMEVMAYSKKDVNTIKDSMKSWNIILYKELDNNWAFIKYDLE